MQRPVFLVNSRLGRVTAAPSGYLVVKTIDPTGAPLLPKLRGHFAEFLNDGSLDRLGILYPPTCVGFGTGGLDATCEDFLGGIATPTSSFDSPSRLSLYDSGFTYCRPTRLAWAPEGFNHNPGSIRFPRPSSSGYTPTPVQEY
jgi:hypothetical protein